MAKPDNAGAGSMPYLHLTALVMFGHMRGQVAQAAQVRLAQGADNAGFYEKKLITARCFSSHLLPATKVHRARVAAGAEKVMALGAEAF